MRVIHPVHALGTVERDDGDAVLRGVGDRRLAAHEAFSVGVSTDKVAAMRPAGQGKACGNAAVRL